MSLRVCIGGVSYALIFVHHDLIHPGGGATSGGVCNGLTWPDRGLIQVDGRLPATRRRKVMWHELGHAFKDELDICRSASGMDEESFCDLVALAFCGLSPKLYCRLWLYATKLVVAPDVALLPGMSEPVAVHRWSDEPPEILQFH